MDNDRYCIFIHVYLVFILMYKFYLALYATLYDAKLVKVPIDQVISFCGEKRFSNKDICRARTKL
jgi:hypothetical protein